MLDTGEVSGISDDRIIQFQSGKLKRIHLNPYFNQLDYLGRTD